MALNFPNSPVDGQTYNGYIYEAASTSWRSANPFADTLPAGTIVQWGGTSAPGNWLLCDGSAVSRTTYAALYSIIGTAYGVGDGSSTFNLPDLRGRIPVGKNSGTFSVLGAAGGEEAHVLTEAELAYHKHSDLGHVHSQVITANAGGPGIRWDYRQDGSSWSYPQGVTTDWGYANIGYTGSNVAHNNLQPYQVVNYIIKTTFGTTNDMSQGALTVAEYAARLTALETRTSNTILQVLSATKNTPQTGTTGGGGTFVDISSLSVTISPRSTTSKILVTIMVNGSVTYDGMLRVLRDNATVVGGGSGGGQNGTSFLGTRGNTYEGFTGAGMFLDSPGTVSPVNYKVQIACNNSYYINRAQDGDTSERPISSITVMEVAQ